MLLVVFVAKAVSTSSSDIIKIVIKKIIGIIGDTAKKTTRGDDESLLVIGCGGRKRTT